MMLQSLAPPVRSATQAMPTTPSHPVGTDLQPPRFELKLRGGYPLSQLDRLLTSLGSVGVVERPTQVIVDLAGLARISAPALAVLVSTLQEMITRGLLAEGSRLIAPKNFLVRRYLERMDVVRLLVDTAPPEDFARGPDYGFRPCQQFSTDDELQTMTTELSGALHEACDTDSASENAVWWALNEIGGNVLEHARTLSGGVAIAQASRGRQQLDVAIADSGIGIRASLNKNPAHEVGSDLEALRVALTGGTSGRADGLGGVGLYGTSRLLAANGGSLFLRSGTASIETGAVYQERLGLPELRGTLVALTFRTDRELSMQPIMEDLGIS